MALQLKPLTLCKLQISWKYVKSRLRGPLNGRLWVATDSVLFWGRELRRKSERAQSQRGLSPFLFMSCSDASRVVHWFHLIAFSSGKKRGVSCGIYFGDADRRFGFIRLVPSHYVGFTQLKSRLFSRTWHISVVVWINRHTHKTSSRRLRWPGQRWSSPSLYNYPPNNYHFPSAYFYSIPITIYFFYW